MYEYEVMYADDMSLIAGFNNEDEIIAWIEENCTNTWSGSWDEDCNWYYNGERIAWSW